MRNVRRRIASLTAAEQAAGLMALLLLLGAIIWVFPFLARKQTGIAGVPGPGSALPYTYRLVPGSRACMNAVTLEPSGHLAAFVVIPTRRKSPEALRIELLLRAETYRERATTPTGYRGGPIALPVTPPRRAAIGDVCWVNRGRHAVLLNGTTDPRTVTRSHMLVDSIAKPGSASLTFYDRRSRSLLSKLGDAFNHVSNLTDRLLPPALLWVFLVVTLLAAPIVAIAALHSALSEDDADGSKP